MTMLFSHEGNRLIVQTPGKVNLHLEILGKRPDGYHELETLIVAVGLYDRLEFQQQESGTTVTSSDPELSVGDDNLVTRAIALVRQESGIETGVSVSLEKRIPMAAGMAGGSSDAAATLAALNLLWGLNWSRERMAELGGRLGSDVPFFFYAPAAICRGRGEIVTSCPCPAVLHFVVVRPREGLSTKSVFSRITVPDEPVSVSPMENALQAGDTEKVGQLLHNRLEEASLALSEAVTDLQRRANSWNCLGHRMSGSGSAYFALCRSAEDADELARQLREQNLGSVFVVTNPSQG